MEDVVSVAWLRAQQRWAGRPPTIIDAREPAAYAAGHIPGARNLPLDALPARAGEVPRDRPVVVYGDTRHLGPSRGERAAALLRARGREAFALEGDFPAWEAAGHPIETGPERGGAGG